MYRSRIKNLAPAIAHPLYYERIGVRADRENELQSNFVPCGALATRASNGDFIRRSHLFLPVFAIPEFFNIRRLNFNYDLWSSASGPEVKLGHFIAGSPCHTSQRKTQSRHLVRRSRLPPFFEDGFSGV